MLDNPVAQLLDKYWQTKSATTKDTLPGYFEWLALCGCFPQLIGGKAIYWRLLLFGDQMDTVDHVKNTKDWDFSYLMCLYH